MSGAERADWRGEERMRGCDRAVEPDHFGVPSPAIDDLS
jgi:hypothetical protein